MGEREDRIKQLWRVEALRGVVMHPMADIVGAMANKGYDVSAAQKLLRQGDGLYEAGRYNKLLMLICDLNHALRASPKVAEPEFDAPTSLEEIKEGWPKAGRQLAGEYDLGDYYDKVYGGWLGKCIGGALGGPVEGWSHQRVMSEYSEIRSYTEEPPSTLNDDTAYEVLLIHAIEEYGPNFTSEQLGKEWVGHLPVEYTYTAERVAVENMMRGVMPPQSGYTDNPFSEWIGAQMKGEVCGFIAPGRPEIAIEYAYRDGVIAHSGEGVYGEIFDAALVSAAFLEKDARELLEIGLSYVPERSKFAKVVRDAIGWCERARTWQEAVQEVIRAYDQRYHWAHTFPNIANVIIGLLFGDGDFEKTLCITTMCGLDADCTAGQVGAILGVIVGAEEMPGKWKDPLKDRLDTYAIGFEQLRISEFAQRTCDIGKTMAKCGVARGVL